MRLVIEQLLVLVFCDNFEPKGVASWKLRYPWVGGNMYWTGMNGFFTMDFAFMADYVLDRLGAYTCIVIILGRVNLA